jgi:ubiquinone/menaquinone biosynthesis C-methylase UbiE
MNKLHEFNPTTRFSDRAKIYSAYRPTYPLEAIKFLNDKQILTPDKKVADIGAGTGIFSKLLLDNGNEVYCVEPNTEMMQEGITYLSHYDKCKWISGTSEHSSITSGTIDVITCAQAFHWFEPISTREEFIRISKNNTHVVLIWNSRKKDENDFTRDYNKLVKYFGKNYEKINEANSNDDAIAAFYSKKPSKAVFENNQKLSCQALLGRVFSSSYMPYEGSPNYQEAQEAFKSLFEQYNTNGIVIAPYETRVYYGELN